MRAVSAVMHSRGLRFWLPFVSALVLVAGIAAFLIVYNVGGIRNTANVPVPQPGTEPATPAPAKRKTVKPSEDALNVIIRFLDTAVPRKSLAESYRLTAPQLRQGLTLKQWLTGSIPVVFYPVGERGAGFSNYSVEWSYSDEVMLRVLLTPRKESKLRPQEFWVGAKLIGKGDARRWGVHYFAPRWFPPRYTAND